MIKEIALEHKPTSITASNIEERSYTISDTIVKKGINGKMRVVLIESDGLEIYPNRKSITNIVNLCGWNKKNWIGCKIYPLEIIDYPKGKSITWMTTDKQEAK